MYLINKYTKVYNAIIERAKNRELNSYFEKHHVVPQSLGGSNDKENIVKLTAREHFICHLLLTKMVEGTNKSKMYQAAWMMASCIGIKQERYSITNRQYENLKIKMSQIKKSMTTWNKEKSPSDSTRLKLRAASIQKLVLDGKITQEEADYRNSLPLSEIKKYNKRKPKEPKKLKGRSKGGWKWSTEAREKLSAQRMGRTPWNKGRSSKQSSGHDSELS
jgi:hypothetical protein